MATLIMATRAPDTIGFPAILNEMLRSSHYFFQPEYEVYARGCGVGLVDYMASLHLEPRWMVGAVRYNFRACGTSVQMVIQEVAREAIARLRHEHRELWEAPFTYLPVRGPEDPIAHVVSPPMGPYTFRLRDGAPEFGMGAGGDKESSRPPPIPSGALPSFDEVAKEDHG
jgi:hypothetical protein